MYLVVRESLGMSPGKVAAQVGHAVGLMAMDYMGARYCWTARPGEIPVSRSLAFIEAFDEWVRSDYTKVTLRADEKQWAKLLANPPEYMHVAHDNGKTEIAAGSLTVAVLPPMRKSEAKPHVKRMQLY